MRKLAELDRRGVHVMARRDIEKIFPEEGEKVTEKSLQRMVADGLLQRVTKGLYLTRPRRAKTAGLQRRSPSPCVQAIFPTSAWSRFCPSIE
ncbi:type IV toxin-antitoxin system AbiEi family antitoxin domain-containing protein [Herbaspirillum sp. RTI4]|nr:type IV toxin-antitoxin system AbiEi family antitoxin domain-containing protein [Herbaspirillum sp. RTI4]MDY7579936.1 type IV toxin-antitoxin system AbiEi family antitoxin domain-containing protein [Herbaspirillum sp. RTI4]MEA9983544.1 type IV toxin-antitoxin system AbiEi family antitoxin domain-containing protein [Herbaspirillum sp. RTI4]